MIRISKRTINKEDIGVRLGDVYGHLTVLADVSDFPLPGGSFRRQYLCQCDCEDHTLLHVAAYKLKNGTTKDCGCSRTRARELIGDFKEIGYSLSAEKAEYFRLSAINSCYNPASVVYFNANGQGIEVCPQWQDPETGVQQFYADMAPSYVMGCSLDRIDYTKGFTPENCCWTPISDYTKKVKDQGDKYYFEGHNLTMYEWSRLVGTEGSILRHRFSMGWPMYEVLYGAPYKSYHITAKNAVYFFNDDGTPIFDQTTVTKGALKNG